MFFPWCCPAPPRSMRSRAMRRSASSSRARLGRSTTKTRPPADASVFELGVPVLGICYGLQFMVHTLGGKVRPADKREYGHAEVDIVAESVLFQGLAKLLACGCRTATKPLELPPGFELTAKTLARRCRHSKCRQEDGMRCSFTPKFTTRRNGTRNPAQFCIFEICGAKPTWTPQHFIDSTVEQVRQQVGNGTRHLRAFRRRGFIGRRGAGRPRHARCERQIAADLRLREQRRAAQERIRKSAEDPARQARPASRSPSMPPSAS